MAGLWRVSDAASLALHAMAFVAAEPERRATTHEIAAAFGVSEHHLAKVNQRLVRAGLLEAARGPHGGVCLARPPQEITLMQVYQVIEGPAETEPCVLGHPTCGRTACIFGDLVGSVNHQVRQYLESTTLDRLAEPRSQSGTSSERRP